MAKILPHTSSGEFRGYDIETQGPNGSYPARIVDIKDYFGVDVQKFGEIGVTEKKDTCFVLVAYIANGETHLVSTFEMKQSGSPKSKLFNFIKDINGEAPTFDGEYDTVSEIGKPLQVTVASKVSRLGKTYNYIASQAPLLEELWDKAPKLEDVEIPGGRSVPLAGEDPFKVDENDEAI